MAWGPACRQVWLLLAFLLFPRHHPPTTAFTPMQRRRGRSGHASVQQLAAWCCRGATNECTSSSSRCGVVAGHACRGCLLMLAGSEHPDCQGKRMHVKLGQQQTGFPWPWLGTASSSGASCAAPHRCHTAAVLIQASLTSTTELHDHLLEPTRVHPLPCAGRAL